MSAIETGVVGRRNVPVPMPQSQATRHESSTAPSVISISQCGTMTRTSSAGSRSTGTGSPEDRLVIREVLATAGPAGSDLLSTIVNNAIAGLPLRQPWVLVNDAQGEPLYVNWLTGETTREAPLEPSLTELADDRLEVNISDPSPSEVQERQSDVRSLDQPPNGQPQAADVASDAIEETGEAGVDVDSASNVPAPPGEPTAPAAHKKGEWVDPLAAWITRRSSSSLSTTDVSWAAQVLEMLANETLTQPGRSRPRKPGASRLSTPSILRALGLANLLHSTPATFEDPSNRASTAQSGNMTRSIASLRTPPSPPQPSSNTSRAASESASFGYQKTPAPGLLYARSDGDSPASSSVASAARRKRGSVPALDLTKVHMGYEDDDDEDDFPSDSAGGVAGTVAASSAGVYGVPQLNIAAMHPASAESQAAGLLRRTGTGQPTQWQLDPAGGGAAWQNPKAWLQPPIRGKLLKNRLGFWEVAEDMPQQMLRGASSPELHQKGLGRLPGEGARLQRASGGSAADLLLPYGPGGGPPVRLPPVPGGALRSGGSPASVAASMYAPKIITHIHQHQHHHYHVKVQKPKDATQSPAALDLSMSACALDAGPPQTKSNERSCSLASLPRQSSMPSVPSL